ncbi:hypothetical protein BHE74_00005777 [Ensete ventricosum]|uniref:Uncharacterized protein n=1 Tax=Ensete ventricosum TaxID=4639 RepID=A0A444FXC3_ENSVE|nr:hypothetical protein GW17_00008303 [Ensete ventricosum]RWW85530.1 hypothetical protein BHE74_00005777 [Ensete ventricosum]RZR70978.1 hypothetical protein BHM03_00002579 [Ensete ventricosum]
MRSTNLIEKSFLQVSSATATFAMTFSSSMSVVEYYLLKRFPIPYGNNVLHLSIPTACNANSTGNGQPEHNPRLRPPQDLLLQRSLESYRDYDRTVHESDHSFGSRDEQWTGIDTTILPRGRILAVDLVLIEDYKTPALQIGHSRARALPIAGDSKERVAISNVLSITRSSAVRSHWFGWRGAFLG